MNCEGYVDCVVDGVVTGWAWDPARPQSPLVVEFLRNDEVVGEAVAGGFRQDLKEGRIGDGLHGFSADLSALKLAAGSFLNVRVRGTPFELFRSPFRWVPAPRFAAEAAPEEDSSTLLELESYSRIWEARVHRVNTRLSESEKAAGATWLSCSPLNVMIETTNRCNYKCVMCPHGHGLMAGAKHLEVGLIADSMPFLARANRLQLFGTGEPMMSPAFWEIIGSLEPGTPTQLSVNTNGTLLTGDRIERIVRSALTSISISLDAAKPETYAKIRGGDFRSVVGKVATLIRRRNELEPRRLSVFINICLMKENIEEFNSFVELGAELGVDKIEVCHLLDFERHSSWNLKRDGWDFVYEDQLLKNLPGQTQDRISAALARAKELGVTVSFDGSQFDGSRPIYNEEPQ